MSAPERPRTIVYRVAERDEGSRLDLFLKERIPRMSREGVKRAIRERVSVKGRPSARPATALHAGDEVEMAWPLPEEERAEGGAPPPILHEDASIVVVDKPSGILVHATTSSRSLSILGRLRGAGYAGIRLVHRLDRETSGVLLLARSAAAARALSGEFARGSVEKRYLAVVAGEVAADERVIEAPLGAAPGSAIHVKQGVDPARGRAARTEVRVVERLRGFTLVEARPRTGRRHQIRVHLASIGHPVAGDRLYGGRGAEPRAPRLLLHAASIAFRHPERGDHVRYDASVPPDMEGFLAALRCARSSPSPSGGRSGG